MSDNRSMGASGLIKRLAARRKRGSTPPSFPLPALGTLLADRFRLEQRFFTSPLWSTFAATDLERELLQVTAHVFHYDRIGDRKARERGREALARDCAKAIELDHENLVTTLQHGRQEGLEFLVTERVRGRPLSHVLGKLATGRVAVNRAVKLLFQLLRGLEHAHARGAVHGCVDLENTLLLGADQIKLAGFGMRALIDPEDELRGVIERRFACTSPETIRGDLPSPESDVYSAAAILYALIDGSPPFGDVGREARLGHQMFQLPLSTHIPPELFAVIEKGMGKDPRVRFEGAGALRVALAAAAGVETESPEPVAVAELDRVADEEDAISTPSIQVIPELSDETIVAAAVAPPAPSTVDGTEAVDGAARVDGAAPAEEAEPMAEAEAVVEIEMVDAVEPTQELEPFDEAAPAEEPEPVVEIEPMAAAEPAPEPAPIEEPEPVESPDPVVEIEPTEVVEPVVEPIAESAPVDEVDPAPAPAPLDEAELTERIEPAPEAAPEDRDQPLETVELAYEIETAEFAEAAPEADSIAEVETPGDSEPPQPIPSAVPDEIAALAPEPDAVEPAAFARFLETLAKARGVSGAAIVDEGGRIIQVRGEAENAAALGAAARGIARSAAIAAREVEQAATKLILLENEEGIVVLVPLPRGFVLTILADSPGVLGLVRFETKKMLSELRVVIERRPAYS